MLVVNQLGTMSIPFEQCVICCSGPDGKEVPTNTRSGKVYALWGEKTLLLGKYHSMGEAKGIFDQMVNAAFREQGIFRMPVPQER